jgi:hypothetical protein
MLHSRAGYRSARPIPSITHIRLATHGRSIQKGQIATYAAHAKIYRCPLCPENDSGSACWHRLPPLMDTVGISASATPEIAGIGSFDQLVGTDQDGRWEGQAERFCHPCIDDQLNGGGLLNRNVSGLSPFQYLVDKIAVAAELT